MPKWKIKVTPDRDVALSVDGLLDGEVCGEGSMQIDGGKSKYVAKETGEKLFTEIVHSETQPVQFDAMAWVDNSKLVDLTRTLAAGEWLFFDCRPHSSGEKSGYDIETGVIGR